MTYPPHIQMSNASIFPVREVDAIDEDGEVRRVSIADERPLTIYLNKQEVVTLMTLGTHPEALVLGYLHNQGFLKELSDIRAVQVDWETDSAAVVTAGADTAWQERLARRTVTSGCGQGTMFGDQMDFIENLQLDAPPLPRSRIYALLNHLSKDNAIYRQAGAVHGCALCHDDGVIYFVEDVGRHNAVDAIAGMMWLEGISGTDKIFYTTGRLTSEMVIKVAQMKVPVLLSRSGITDMGLRIAKTVGLILVGRAKGRHFLIFNGSEHIS